MPFTIPPGWIRYGMPRLGDDLANRATEAGEYPPLAAHVVALVEEAAHEPSRSGRASSSGRGWHTYIEVWLDPRTGEQIGESEPLDWSAAQFDRILSECESDPTLCERPRRRYAPAILAASTVGVGVLAAVIGAFTSPAAYDSPI